MAPSPEAPHKTGGIALQLEAHNGLTRSLLIASPLSPSPPLLDVCIGFPHPLFTTSPLRCRPPLLDTHRRGPFPLVFDCSSASPPPRLAAVFPTRHPIHANHAAILQYIHSPRATSSPRLVNSDSSSVKTPVSLRARWMDPASTERLGRLNPVAPVSSLRPCLASFHSRSCPPLGSSPFTLGSCARQDGIQRVSNLVDTTACEMDGRSCDGYTWVQNISIPVAPVSPLRTCLASVRYDDDNSHLRHDTNSSTSRTPATGTDAPLLAQCLCWVV
ncbi:hypothetical protein FB45DRAFT_1065643 [Roridomyces roridus]|uniref:Uncharacterized protein n=1 Tax=Roridomyces roridus TaxID=1738132 RepID=A0AAD7FA27_9AGAR|nr:hypothetical protein FB45DRAFT_1065643 [Roridomyces roridus]